MKLAAIAFAFCAMTIAAAADPLRKANGGPQVDLALVIALDASSSMDLLELSREHHGFVAAFRDPEVQRAIGSGAHGRVAVTCFMWSGAEAQAIMVPWTVIDGPPGALAFADALGAARPEIRRRGTAIGAALAMADGMLRASGLSATREVVNIAGDGMQNDGQNLKNIRDALIARGVTINGMPIVPGLVNSFAQGEADPDRIIAYYEERVIGGPDAFVEPAMGVDDLVTAIRRKLLREITTPGLYAARPPPRIYAAADIPAGR